MEGLFCGFLEFGGEGGVGGEETGVDCGDDGEEGYGFFGGVRGGEEGRAQAFPYGGCVEGELEFDGCAGEEGG